MNPRRPWPPPIGGPVPELFGASSAFLRQPGLLRHGLIKKPQASCRFCLSLFVVGQFNEELVKAGLILAGEGLHPSSRGKRVRFSGPKRTMLDGPFAETKELIAGFWLWQVQSMDEAVEWVRRCPNPMEGESEIEIRPVFETEDFGEALTPELKAQEDRLRAKTDAQAKAR